MKLTEEQRIEVGKLTERLRQVENMLGIARDWKRARRANLGAGTPHAPQANVGRAEPRSGRDGVRA